MVCFPFTVAAATNAGGSILITSGKRGAATVNDVSAMLVATDPRRAKLIRRSSTNGGDVAPTMGDGLAIRAGDSSVADAADLPPLLAGWTDAAPARKALRLVPIIPGCEMLPGAMDIDMDRSQLVYLAPITSVKKEIYRDKHNPKASGSPERNKSLDGPDFEYSGSDSRSAGKKSNLRSPVKHRVPASLGRSKNFAKPDRGMMLHTSTLMNQHLMTRSDLANSLNTQQQQQQQMQVHGSSKQNNTVEREENNQLARLKQKVRLLPISDADRQEFWESMRKYQKLQMQYHKSLLYNQSTPMGFNMEAAWCKKLTLLILYYQLYDERHRQWAETHENRIIQSKERKAIEDEAFDKKIMESTTQYRAQMRMLREIRERLQIEAQNVLPTVMLCSFTQKMLVKLLDHWKVQRLQIRLRGIVRFWRQQRSSCSVNSYATLILINWLRKSVAIKSVAFRVFRGIRTYMRRVKKLQSMWRVKSAKRELNLLLLQRLWIKQETLLVDAAAEKHEKKLLKHDQVQARKNKKPAAKKHIATDGPDMWLTFVDGSLRARVIREFLRDVEKEYVDKFRQQELDLFPQLVQTLRCEQPNRARSYVKVIASNYALLGRVRSVLQLFPGAVDDVPAIALFDVHRAPVKDLIRKARSISPPDTTGSDPFWVTPTNATQSAMQNDEQAQLELLDAGNEERKKRFALLLEKRRQLREHAPPHPADASVTLVHKAQPSHSHANPKRAGKEERAGVSTREILEKLEDSANADRVLGATGNHVTPKELGQLKDSVGVGVDRIEAQIVASSSVNIAPIPETAQLLEEGAVALATSKNVPTRSYGLVVVSCSFRHLPSLSEKTKEIATTLFNALVDTQFNRFSRRGSRLLLNPSVIEFQDTMKELQGICESDSSFFLCLSPHGARVTKGANEGSYVLFSESRLSSEDELLLTAVHESELARLIHAIPSRNKLIALELCHLHEPKEPPPAVAASIRNRVHAQFPLQLQKMLAQMQLDGASQAAAASRAAERSVAPSNTVLLEACDFKAEISLSCMDDGVSNFLHRLSDAFRGGAVPSELDVEEADRCSLHVFEIAEYVIGMVRKDAEKHNKLVKGEYKKQVRTKYELVAEFQEIAQTPQLLDKDEAGDFGLGTIPAPPALTPTAPKMISSTLNSILIAWSYPSAGIGADIPTVLGYHVQYRGSGRASVDADLWKRASSFQVLTFEEAVREKRQPPVSITVFGLGSDTGYCFRVRARSAGGWGPFSIASPEFRTLSYSSIHDQHSTIQNGIQSDGVQGIVKLMKKHSEVRSVQQHCIEELDKLAMHRKPFGREKTPFLPSLDMPVVLQVCAAMQKFKRDFVLQRHASLFIGRLCESSDDWRKKMLSCKEPGILALLQDVSKRFEVTDYETHSCAMWACKRIRGELTIIRRKVSKEEAAKCIQGMYRTRKARQYLRTLAQAIYRRVVDPATGLPYFYNTRTGTTSWSIPAFLS